MSKLYALKLVFVALSLIVLANLILHIKKCQKPLNVTERTWKTVFISASDKYDYEYDFYNYKILILPESKTKMKMLSFSLNATSDLI